MLKGKNVLIVMAMAGYGLKCGIESFEQLCCCNNCNGKGYVYEGGTKGVYEKWYFEKYPKDCL